jgi:hypothetical protein
MKSVFIILGIAFLICSCKTSQTVIEQEPVVDSGPQLLFLVYKFQNDEVILASKIVTEGRLKNNVSLQGIPKTGDLIFKQIDAQKKVLAKEVISNPRIRIVEYADDNGVMQKKEVTVENPEILIRTMLEPKATLITIEEFHEDASKIKLLNTQELK